MTCRHAYEYIGPGACPECGQPTHDVDHEEQSQLFKAFYGSGKHLSYVCPVDGGTIRGWWSI